jgi:hypothetical protein
MTILASSSATMPSRPTWVSLVWTIPFAFLWGWLIFRQPALVEGGLPAMAARIMSIGLIALGLWLGLEGADLTPPQRRTTWLAIMVPFTLWAAAAWTAAINGVFRTGVSPLPFLPGAIFLPIIIGTPVLLMSKRIGQVLDAMPTSWLIALQLYRILGVQWIAYWARGLLPGLFALPAGTGDALTGIFAIATAMAVVAGTKEGRGAGIAWNIFGLLDFALAITLGMLILPGRFQLIIPDVHPTGLDLFPSVLTPSFVVPSSILLHALSLRQLHRRAKAEAVRRSAPVS